MKLTKKIFVDLVILPFTVVCLLAPLQAQTLENMRQYILLRDALLKLKLEIEKSVNEDPRETLLRHPNAELDINNALNDIEPRINSFSMPESPLSSYCREKLLRLYGDCRALFPLFVARMAIGVHNTLPSFSQSTRGKSSRISDGPRNAIPQMPFPENPPTQPVMDPSINNGLDLHAPADNAVGVAVPSVNPVKGREKLVQSTINSPPAIASATSAAKLSRSAISQKPLSETEKSTLAPVKTRKKYFQAISPRAFLAYGTAAAIVPSVISHAKIATSTLSIAEKTIAASKTISLIASFPVLPPPVDSPPIAFTPLIPWSGKDPQIRESPGMRPLAVMIENHAQARPQTGLNEAEVVYEIPVEGGITRFMALFYHVANLIGPIRSCREYFLDRALEVNALYVHCGGSPNGYKYIGKVKAFAIDEISNGEPFFRDNSRKAPHNLYAKMQKIIDNMNKKYPMQLPYQRLPFLYGELETLSPIPAKGVSIKYHGNYTASFRFNGRYNVYHRYMNGIQHLDRVSLRPVAPGTVIVQEAIMKVVDDKGRQEIDFIGQGKAFILHGGTVSRATWKKDAPRDFTRFYDENGKPFIFSNKAPIWVQVVDPKNTVTFDPPLYAPALTASAQSSANSTSSQ